MKIIGLITEYNPFHNGHRYHLEKSKKDLGADYCIALMSGSFVQRGAPAVYDKYTRTTMALQSGADLVIEMPAAFSTASAGEFAAYGIALFSALGAVNAVSFGSECGDLESLQAVAALLSAEPEEYSSGLKQGLKQGMTFPEAREKALLSYLKPEHREILSSPNNILGIEYCRGAIKLHSPLTLYTIKREGHGYHDNSTEGNLGSATAIREALLHGMQPESVQNLIPSHVLDCMKRDTPVFPNDFSSVLNYRIWMGTAGFSAAAGSPEASRFPIEAAADMTPELAARIRRSALNVDTFEARIQELKSRQITYTRVSRALLHLLLGIGTEQMERFKEAGYAPYARILGFRRASAPLLTALKDASSIPLITKLADADSILSPVALSLLQQEINASHLYQGVKKEKGCAFKNEYKQPILIL